MNKKVFNHIKQFAEKNDWICETENDAIDIITNTDSIKSTIIDSHRWYDTTEEIAEIDGMFIMYDGYHITGDNSMFDMGLDYEPGSFCEAKKVLKVVEHYVEVDNEE